MKTLQKTLIASAVALTITNGVAMADSWTLIQDTTVASDLTITQDGARNHSIQSINAINDPGADISGGSSQAVTYSGSTLTMKQGETEGNVNSNQALNYLRGENIGTTIGTAISQTVNQTGGSIRMKQKTSASGTNFNAVQSINRSESSQSTSNLSQTATAPSINMEQNYTASSNKNTQATNNASSTRKIRGSTQKIASDINMTQTVSATNYQYGNRFETGGKNSNSSQSISQTSSGKMIQDGSGRAIQAANSAMSRYNSINNLDQTLTGSLTLQQKTVGRDSVQAINEIETLNNALISAVNSSTQTVGNGSETYKLNQTDGQSGVIQAANLLRTTSTDLTIGATQTIKSSTLKLVQDNGTNSLQSGNTVITDYAGLSSLGGKVTQNTTLATLSLDQNGATGAHQAVNYGGVKPQ